MGNLHVEKFRILKEVWGFTSFRQGQEAVNERVREKKVPLAMMPTGGGKSLCYQLPA